MIKIGSITEVGFSDFSASEKLPIVITLNTDRGSGIYRDKKSGKSDFLENLESDLPFPTRSTKSGSW